MGDLKIKSTKKSRAALEAAILEHGHPAAIADLQSYAKNSADRTTFLDATFQTCRDQVLWWAQGVPSHVKRTNMGCVLARALHLYGMPNVEHLPEAVMKHAKSWLKDYGRPISQKKDLVNTHTSYAANYRKEHSLNSGKGYESLQTSKNVTKEQQHVSNEFQWDQLERIAIRDLKIFETQKGKYIEGKLLVDPFTMVGCNTIMEDQNGDVLLITLYNFLPNGVTGVHADPIAFAKLPRGCTVRVAEPFLKVFKDGARGARIENPSEITVLPRTLGRGNEDQMLEAAKANGNVYYQKEQYNAAIDSYVDGLRKAESVPTLLSNRSEAFLMAEQYHHSMADAAASLTIQPNSEKTWKLYNGALAKMQEAVAFQRGKFKKTQLIVTTLLDSLADLPTSEANGNFFKAFQIKGEAARAFKNKNFWKAIQLYTDALALVGKTCRALLSNCSQCCLNIGGLNDSFANAAASLRIAYDGKAFYRLNVALVKLQEPNLSIGLIEKMNTRNTQILELYKIVYKTMDSMRTGRIRVEIPNVEHLPFWFQDVETFQSEGKGRGVRAKRDLIEGQVVIIEHPIAFAELNTKENLKKFECIGEKNISDDSQYLLCDAITCRAHREGLLSNIVDKLYDGLNEKPLTRFMQLVPNLCSTQILLPSYHDHMLGTESVDLTSKQVQDVVTTNCFGSIGNGFGMTKLYPAISMFNHSKDPNCIFYHHPKSKGNVQILVTTKDVRAMEELTICYHPDENYAKENWNF